MMRKYFSLILAFVICSPLWAMEQKTKIDEQKQLSPKNFTELTNNIQYVILEFVCEPSKQPHVFAVNIIRAYANYSLINKNCERAVTYKLSRFSFKNGFEGKLFTVLEKNKIRAVEPTGIRLLKNALVAIDDPSKEIALQNIETKEIPYFVTAMAIAILMNNKKCLDLIVRFYSYHLWATDKIVRGDCENALKDKEYRSACMLLPGKYGNIEILGQEPTKLDQMENGLVLCCLGTISPNSFQPYVNIVPYMVGGINYQELMHLLKIGFEGKGCWKRMGPKDPKQCDSWMLEMYQKYKPYLIEKDYWEIARLYTKVFLQRLSSCC